MSNIFVFPSPDKFGLPQAGGSPEIHLGHVSKDWGIRGVQTLVVRRPDAIGLSAGDDLGEEV
jgi:hypothetical protein